MLHQPITIDSDTAQAVEDILPTVMELRRATVVAATAPCNLDARAASEAYVRELADLIASRASSVHITADELLRLANERIATDRRLPVDGTVRSNARKVVELARAKDAARDATTGARDALRSARAAVTAAEHRERMVEEEFRRAAGLSSGAGQ